MDQKRLFVAIALSIAVLLLFDMFLRPERQQVQQATRTAQQAPAEGVPLPAGPGGMTAQGAPAPAEAAPARPPARRVQIETPRLLGAINARGARLDDLTLRDFRETLDRNSPLVRLLAPRDTREPYFVQWGWTAADGRTRVPDGETDWEVEGGPLTVGRAVTLRWDNGGGVTFEIALSVDENFLFRAEQRVINRTDQPVVVLPWSRIRREVTPHVEGFFILHEGFVGVIDGRLQEWTYTQLRDEANRRRGLRDEAERVRAAFEGTGGRSWAGFTDKYWLAALIGDGPQPMRFAFRHIRDGAADRWQVDMATPEPVTIAAGATGTLGSRVFAGAKEVLLLDAYRDRYGITDFDKAVDFGWFYFLTKPFFYALHWLSELFGNMGVAILVFTLIIKIIFFPLANKSYQSMSRMKILAPKMQEIKERYKDDPQKAQAEMMALYRAEKVNPASGCLPILIQIPVFFALYKVLFVTIEMRHAPFFGWVQDLSAADPTNAFELFGLLPWGAPSWLHLPAWAILMGITMWAQFKLNPTPPDPIQAKVFGLMPILFTFMLASFPAGLVIYWTWNNLLSIAQQAWIMRHERAARRAERKAAAVAKPKGKG
ncbi:MAG: membrane protein insertase YidC [Acetobacteraceae bacterium]|nr:membrane protein insertase YidC [Acetobacteraceae bacterium]